MSESPTHYDLLRVAPDATPEAIRESYRRLSGRFHPDRHPRHAEAAARIMAAINVAYAVLSDPVQRERYDLSIGVPLAPARARAGTPPRAPHAGVRAWEAEMAARRRRRVGLRLAVGSGAVSVLAVAALLWLMAGAPVPGGAGGDSGSPRDDGERAPARMASKAAGASSAPGPLQGVGAAHRAPPAFDALAFEGLDPEGGDAQVLLDNRLGDSDVLVRLYRVTPEGPVPARQVRVRAGSRGLAADLRAGPYELRYLVLDRAFAARSAAPLDLPGGRSAREVELVVRVDGVDLVRGLVVPITPEEFLLLPRTAASDPRGEAGRR